MKTYNGWTNYATWSVNLGVFDGFDTKYYSDDTYTLSQELKTYLSEILEETSYEKCN